MALRWAIGAAILSTSTLVIGADADVQTLGADQFRLLVEVLQRMKNDYVEPLEDKQLLGACIAGMVSSIDRDSSFIDPESFHELTSNGKGGVGLELGMEDGIVKVVAPIDGTPAQLAGLISGDLILSIDESPTRGMTLGEAVKRLRGQPSTHVSLQIARKGEALPLSFTLKREIVVPPPVSSRFVEPGYAYIRLAQFQDITVPSLAQHLNNALGRGYIGGLILDLRNNSGGLFLPGIGVAAAFLKKNALVLTTEGRAKDAKRKYFAIPEDYSRDRKDVLANLPPQTKSVPMVVLVNGGTAAGSEIVASALQDHGRAIVIGTKTFGRSSIQTVLPLSSGDTALKLTTARWYTPKGRSVSGTGVVPDIVVSETPQETAGNAPRDDPQIARALLLFRAFKAD